MTRPLLATSELHEGIRAKVAKYHDTTVNEVIKKVESEPILVVGMRQNPVCKSVQKTLNSANINYDYLEYGSYLKDWKPRLAIKMWSGWPTFPMVFVKGQLIGGNHELTKLINSGELEKLLA